MSFPLFPFCGIRCRRTRSDLFQLKVARDSTGRSVQFLVAVVGFHQRASPARYHRSIAPSPPATA